MTLHDWSLLAAASGCLVAGVLAFAWYRRFRSQDLHLRTALNNMSEGLCMSAAETRGSAENVLATSQAVEKAADDLRLEVEGFLGKVAV